MVADHLSRVMGPTGAGKKHGRCFVSWHFCPQWLMILVYQLSCKGLCGSRLRLEILYRWPSASSHNFFATPSAWRSKIGHGGHSWIRRDIHVGFGDFALYCIVVVNCMSFFSWMRKWRCVHHNDSYNSDMKLGGVIYLHDISLRRMIKGYVSYFSSIWPWFICLRGPLPSPPPPPSK